MLENKPKLWGTRQPFWFPSNQFCRCAERRDVMQSTTVLPIECVTKSLLPILFQYRSGIVSHPQLKSLTVRQIIGVPVVSSFPVRLTLCGGEDGSNECWLSSLPQIWSHPENVSTLTLSPHNTTSPFVGNDGNLCCFTLKHKIAVQGNC